MTTVRKNYRLPEDIVEIIKKTKESGGYSTETEAVISMIRSFGRDGETSLTEKDKIEVANLVVASIHERYKKTFDRIRLASTFSERYGYLLLNVMNTMLYETDASYLMPAEGEQAHPVIRESLARYKDMVERNKQVKDNDNLKRG